MNLADMTADEAFALGFARRLVDDRYGEGQPFREVLAQATEKVAGVLGDALNFTSEAAGLGLPLLVAAPLGAGVLGGAALAGLTDVDDTDVREIGRREMIARFNVLSAQARARRSVRDQVRPLTTLRPTRL